MPHSLATNSAWFQALPIRRKLMFALLFTSTAALLLAGVGIVAVDSFLFYSSLQRDLQTLAQIVADGSTAALTFGDEKSARERLATLRAREHLEVACLYLTDGSVLASYSRSPKSGSCPKPQLDVTVTSSANSMDLSQPVVLQNKRIGTLVIRYNLEELVGRIWLYSALVLGVLLVSSLFAVLLSTRLRSVIASPILDLAASAAFVTRNKDYSIRAPLQSPDEVGELVNAFNEMLASIESREGDLQKSLDAQKAGLVQLGRANADLQRLNSDLERTNQDLERFAFIASHDLQEPLRMITSYSQLLVKQYPSGGDGGQQAIYTQRIVDGTKRMRKLLSDLLAYAEASAAPTAPGTVDLRATIEKVLENLRMSIEESGAQVVVDDLPTLTADEGQLNSLFQNLIENAIKYRSDSPPRIHISASCGADGPLVFSVADNGVGIEPQFHQTIFTVFKRLHGKDIPGTGIGLAICQRIVDQYGGRLWVESPPIGGTIFCFTLPKSNPVSERKGTT
ncbi:MAG: ATP-binding protein [Bryobacteraceae bacterium]